MNQDQKVGFFAAIPKSIYSPEFYKQIPNRTFGKAFGYFLGVSFLMTVMLIALLARPLLWNRTEIIEGIETFLNSYPAELVITIKGGEASTNVEEPYIMAFPSFEADEEFTETFPRNFLVIDTQTPFSIEQMKEYDSFVWLTKDSFVGWGGGPHDEIQVNDLSQFPDVTIDKALIDSGIEGIWATLTKMIPIFALAICIFIYLGLIIVRMIYMLILSIFILMISSMVGCDLKYGESYKVGLHAITASMLVQIIVLGTQQWTGWSGFPYMFSIIALLVVGVNFWQGKKEVEKS